MPAPAECYQLGKPLWTSEGWLFGVRNGYDGALNLAAVLNKNWVITRQQATWIWTLIYAWYEYFRFAHHGLMTAAEPWSAAAAFAGAAVMSTHPRDYPRVDAAVAGARRTVNSFAAFVVPQGYDGSVFGRLARALPAQDTIVAALHQNNAQRN